MLLEDEAKYDEAKQYYLMAIEKGDNYALNNYALLLERPHFNDNIESIKYHYKYYLKSKEELSLYNIEKLLQKEGMAELIGQLLLQ